MPDWPTKLIYTADVAQKRYFDIWYVNTYKQEKVWLNADSHYYY